MIKDGTLGDALWTSLQRVLWGLGIGIVVGAVLALFAGLSRVGDDLVDSNVQMLRFVPIIGLQPLLILWLGLGETAKISLIVMGVAFPVYVQTVSAIRSLDPRICRAFHGCRARPARPHPPGDPAGRPAGLPRGPADGDRGRLAAARSSPSR